MTSSASPTGPMFHVLGCGPAGLMSAHAAHMSGYDVMIHSKKRKSEMFGAQYLHKPIPGISEADDIVSIDYVLQGSEDGYRKKVYGPSWDGKVSPEDLLGKHPGWDIRAAYNRLWDRYSDSINNVSFEKPQDIADLVNSFPDGHVWASSIPATALCFDRQSHAFSSQEVYAIGDAPERGVFCPVAVADDTVVCNGEDAPSWYRASNILGYRTAEWPEGKKPPIQDLAKITKPLKTTCNCQPVLHRVGRYGKWEKGVLSHEAYFDTIEGLSTAIDDYQAELDRTEHGL